MGVQFSIEGQDPKVWACDFNYRNARILAKVIGLNLDPDGLGIHGELSPIECIFYLSAIEKAMTADLSEYAIENSDIQQPVGVASTKGNVTKLKYGLRVANQGIDADGIRVRLSALYVLFQKAVETNSPIVWA